MAKLILGEWRKLTSVRSLWVVFSVLILLNAAAAYRQIAAPQMLDSMTKPEEQSQSYEAFLDSVVEQAEKMHLSSIFVSGRFGEKNLEKTIHAYEKLHGITLESDYPQGVKLAVERPMTDFFLLLAIFAFLLQVLISERVDGQIGLLKPMMKGRKNLIAAKVCTYLQFLFLAIAVFYGTNAAVVSFFGMTGAKDAAIQSLDGYLASPFAISVGEYCAIFFAHKYLALLAIGSLLFLICILCRNMVYTIVAFLLVIAVEAGLWAGLEDYSWLGILRQFNLVCLLDTTAYFNDYTNINLFGFPVNTMAIGLVTAASVIVCCFGTATLVFETEASADKRKNRIAELLHLRKLNTPVHSSLFRIEGYKLWMRNKGLFLLVLFLAVQVFCYGNQSYYTDSKEYYYQEYAAVLQGPLSEKTDEFLEQEAQRFSELEAELEEQYERYSDGEIGEAVLDYYITKLTPEWGQTEAFEQVQK